MGPARQAEKLRRFTLSPLSDENREREELRELRHLQLICFSLCVNTGPRPVVALIFVR